MRSPLWLVEWLLWGNSNRWNVPWVAKTTARLLETCLWSDGWAPLAAPSSLPSGNNGHRAGGRGEAGSESGRGHLAAMSSHREFMLWRKIMSPWTKGPQHRTHGRRVPGSRWVLELPPASERGLPQARFTDGGAAWGHLGRRWKVHPRRRRPHDLQR